MHKQPNNRTLQFVQGLPLVPSCQTAVATFQHQSMILRLPTLVFHVVPQGVLLNKVLGMSKRTVQNYHSPIAVVDPRIAASVRCTSSSTIKTYNPTKTTAAKMIPNCSSRGE